MRIIKWTPGAAQNPPSATALGFFDGVHVGHRQLFSAVCRRARESGLLPSVFTFSDDVRTVKRGSARLTDFDTKLALLEECGIEVVYLADFPALSSLSPEAFVREVLIGFCGTEFAVCGFNFRFGCRAAGDAEVLLRLMREAGGDCEIVPPAYHGERVISASAIRRALEDGDAELAAAMLGRRFSLRGEVLRGRGYGHTEGVPTVNQLFPESGIVPRAGVYVSLVLTSDGRRFPAVTNVGVCPTFEIGDTLHSETHLLDFAGDLYDEVLTVEFCKYLRPEEKFDSPEALYRRVRADVEAARTYLKGEH